jgi:hypothetical protein
MPTSTDLSSPTHRLEHRELVPLQAAADPIQQPPVKPPSTGAATMPNARRLSPRLRKLVLATHVLVAVGWFGAVLAKLVLEITAATSLDPEVHGAAYVFMGAFDRALFPPAAIATLLTGIILSVGTPWGLFRHYWIVAKLVLTIAVVVTGVAFVGAWVEQAIAAGAGPVSMPLIYAALAHVLMLGAATVISIYKPWGRIATTPREPARTGRLQRCPAAPGDPAARRPGGLGRDSERSAAGLAERGHC